MIFIQLSAFILLVMGIIRVLELTPERINKDLSGFFEKRESLQDMSRVARGKKKQNKIVKELSRIRRILTETGKEKNFSVALTLSLILMVVQCQRRKRCTLIADKDLWRNADTFLCNTYPKRIYLRRVGNVKCIHLCFVSVCL